MKITLDQRENSVVALVETPAGAIAGVQDVLDLIATLGYDYDCRALAVSKESFPESFFALRTGIAGELLQKFTTYGVRMAIIGDFSVYTSKSLHDFIYESNKGKRILFFPTLPEALDLLHSGS